jgi:DNA-directed RNA polymerase subunit M/transcription elongation factor TFIIS
MCQGQRPTYCHDCGVMITRKRNKEHDTVFSKILCDACGDETRKRNRQEVEWRSR